MKASSFFKFVEIQTKVASVIPFILGGFFALYRYSSLNFGLAGLFFLSMICIDMATTAINNFMDYKRAEKKSGFNYEEHNAIVRDGIGEKEALKAIFLLVLAASLSGIYLFLLTDWVILLIGLISFFVGIIYSYGPIPISRTPLGEIFSGFFMGCLIFFASVYIQVFGYGFILVNIEHNTLLLNLNILELAIIILVSTPLILMIANIMLANNICDIEDDVDNKRYTLPYFVGKKWSLILFNILYAISFLVIITGVFLKILPVINLLVLVSAIPIAKNLMVFSINQDKALTFSLSVKNFILFSGLWIISFVIYFFI